MSGLTRMHLGDVLVVPLQEELHDTAAEEMIEKIITEAEKMSARGVVIDISALDIVDSFLGRLLQETVHALAAMGKKVVLVGLRPGVAITLVELGLPLEGIETAFNLETALRKL